MLISSHVAYGNIEFSGYLGKKFGGEIEFSLEDETMKPGLKNKPWHLGVDAVYSYSVDGASLGFGLRYRFDFQEEKEKKKKSGKTDKYKFTTHRMALLAIYRVYIDQSFTGIIFGLDIWKYLKFSTNEDSNDSEILTSNQFLWNRISGQLGLEFGFMVTSNFLIKLETGYDLLSFTHFELENQDEEYTKVGFNGFYITFGIGLLFG